MERSLSSVVKLQETLQSFYYLPMRIESEIVLSLLDRGRWGGRGGIAPPAAVPSILGFAMG